MVLASQWISKGGLIDQNSIGIQTVLALLTNSHPQHCLLVQTS